MLIHEQQRAAPTRPAPVVAREVGWKGARGPNAKQRRTEAEGHGVERIPIDGIKGPGLPSRAIVVLPSQLSDATSIDVLLHLHGFTPGYATGDDLGVYKIEAQMAAAGKELLGILPQGSANSDFNGARAGKAFDADAFIAAVFARLVAEGYGVPGPGRVIMSSHSGGDQPLAETLKRKPPEKLAGLFLFDTMIASAFGGAVWSYVDGRLTAELEHLHQMKLADPDSLAVEAQMATWIQQNGFRLMVVYRKGGAYQAAAKAIETNLEARFAAAQPELGPLVFSSLRDHYAVHEVTETSRIGHMDVLAGDDALRNAIETLPTDRGARGRAARARARARAGRHGHAAADAAGVLRGQPRDRAAARPRRGAGGAAGRRRDGRDDAALGPDGAAARVPQGRLRRPSRRLEGRRLRGRQEGRQRRRLARGQARQGLQAQGADRPDARRRGRQLLSVRDARGHGQGRHGRRRARLQPLEPVVHRLQLGARGHRSRQGRRHDHGDDAREVDPGQQAGPADGQEDQRLLRVEQAHGRRAGGGDGLDRVDGRLQPPHDVQGRVQQPLDRVRGRHQPADRHRPERPRAQGGRGAQASHGALPARRPARVELQRLRRLGREGRHALAGGQPPLQLPLPAVSRRVARRRQGR